MTASPYDAPAAERGRAWSKNVKMVLTFMGAMLLVAVAASAPAQAADAMASLDTDTPPGITVQHRHDGIVFADPGGMTLYTYDEDADTPGTSSCDRVRHCERRWPPLTAPEEAKPTGNWSVIRRHDGTPQWAYKGMPVYTSVDDVTPGAMSGDNANQVWHALFQPFPRPKTSKPPGFAVKRHGENWVFADHQGRLLYTIETPPDAAGAGCGTACLRFWLPVQAAMIAHPVGAWSVEARDDGSRQWAYHGKRAYVKRHPYWERAPAQDASAWTLLRVDVDNSAPRMAATK